jgi:hypothetical protein
LTLFYLGVVGLDLWLFHGDFFNYDIDADLL